MFEKGKSGNPKGRESGNRNKLGEAFIADLRELWEEQGKEILKRVAADKPEALLASTARLLPKDVNHYHKFEEVKTIIEDELDRRIANMLGPIVPGVDGEARALPAPAGTRTSH